MENVTNDSRARELGFFRNEQIGRRSDFVSLRKIALIDTERKATARIDVKERLADGDIAEGLVEGDGITAAGEGHGDSISDCVAEPGKCICRNVEYQVAKGAVGSDDLSMQTFVVDGRSVKIEANEPGDIE